MHGKYMGYLVVAAAAVAVGLMLAGTPVVSMLPFLLLLACPLMMVMMMRMMGDGHRAGRGAHRGDDPDHPPAVDAPRPAPVEPVRRR